jgi:transposase
MKTNQLTLTRPQLSTFRKGIGKGVAENANRWQTGRSQATRKPAIMRVRIRISPETVKELLKALPKAYQSGDSRMVKRVIALLDYRRGDQPRGIADQDEVAVSTVYQGLKELLIEGIASLKPQWRGGRGQKLTEKQRHCLREWLQAGRPAAGYPTGGWSALWVQDRIQREFGLLYKADYLAEVLKGGGFSWQKARFVSDHLDEGNRFVWLKEVFPAGKRQAQAAAGLLLFGDQASFAPWGSLGYPWVPLGHQPTVATSGKRRG